MSRQAQQLSWHPTLNKQCRIIIHTLQPTGKPPLNIPTNTEATKKNNNQARKPHIATCTKNMFNTQCKPYKNDDTRKPIACKYD